MEQDVITNFTHDDNGVITSKTVVNSESWIPLLQEFVFFLEGIGFIGVRDKVAIADDSVFIPLNELGWYGPTFDSKENN